MQPSYPDEHTAEAFAAMYSSKQTGFDVSHDYFFHFFDSSPLLTQSARNKNAYNKSWSEPGGDPGGSFRLIYKILSEEYGERKFIVVQNIHRTPCDTSLSLLNNENSNLLVVLLPLSKKRVVVRIKSSDYCLDQVEYRGENPCTT